MAKPVGDRCNLKCEYCFYLGTSEKLSQHNVEIMSDETLATFIESYISQSPSDEVNFVWQGGEPTLAGLAFFEKAVSLQQKHASGKRITNALQTNGIALNHQWMKFLKQNNFLVGISIDGTQTLHDKFRITLSGGSSYDKVKQAIELLNSYQIEYNALCTVNAANWNKGKTVYKNLKSLGVKFIQFIPVVDFNKNKIAKHSIPEKGFGVFLNDVFSEWAKSDIHYIVVMNFESVLSSHVNKHPLICFHQKSCGAPLVIEANGDLFSCDHFVEDKYNLGNIHDVSFESMTDSNAHHHFLALKKVSKECHKCDYLSMCHGGCPKHNLADGRNYLCSSYKHFFKYTHQPMKAISSTLQH